MSNFWSLWIIVLTVISIIGLLWLLLSNRSGNPKGPDQTTGHEYDGIQEYDNPLPAWWMNLFLLTIIFSVGYVIAYPGMGNFKGMLDWTSEKQWQQEVNKANEEFLKLFNSFEDTSVEGLAKNNTATKMGRRLFANYCSTCHGADAGGTRGYPNLTDNEWLYGGSAEQILQSITHGRRGAMPAWESSMNNEQISQVTSYIKNFDGGNAEGKVVYNTYCLACHGMKGEGNVFMGAPNLVDDIWLYGGDDNAIAQSIRNGRSGEMPAHKDLIMEEKIKLIGAYVYSLSQ